MKCCNDEEENMARGLVVFMKEIRAASSSDTRPDSAALLSDEDIEKMAHRVMHESRYRGVAKP